MGYFLSQLSARQIPVSVIHILAKATRYAKAEWAERVCKLKNKQIIHSTGKQVQKITKLNSWFSRTCESCNFHSSVCFIFGARDTCVYDLYRSVVSNQHGFNTFLVTDGFPKNNFNLKFWVILVSCTDRCKKSDWNSIGISGKLSICLRKKNDLYQ